MSNSFFTSFVFTLNNYTQDEYNYILALDIFKYLVIGKEVGENGTPHLQGYAALSKKMRFNQVKKLVSPRAHFERRQGTDVEASDYCKKDGDFVEFGVLNSPGKRSDLLCIKDMLDAGCSEVEIADKYFGSWTRYYKSFKRYSELRNAPAGVVAHDPFAWQTDLREVLEGPSDDRTILFFVNPDGNAGKSWFSQWFRSVHPLITQVLKPGKYADMAYEVSFNSKVIFIDCSRSKTEHLNYDFLESLKDGHMFSPKYESTTKYFVTAPHVVVFMNEEPDMTKLSLDRYSINRI